MHHHDYIWSYSFFFLRDVTGTCCGIFNNLADSLANLEPLARPAETEISRQLLMNVSAWSGKTRGDTKQNFLFFFLHNKIQGFSKLKMSIGCGQFVFRSLWATRLFCIIFSLFFFPPLLRRKLLRSLLIATLISLCFSDMANSM